jgi:hypothetical protein
MDGGKLYPQEQTLDRATVERWRRDAVTAPAQDRLWLNRCEALCNALLRLPAGVGEEER